MEFGGVLVARGAAGGPDRLGVVQLDAVAAGMAVTAVAATAVAATALAPIRHAGRDARPPPTVAGAAGAAAGASG